ncbi:hypothetical protein EDEG_01472 [Edhazardia aedis USNM 41457]|uniref:Uncharacterized protein n=1 Tax=Edhazardia aedis (strain USNM 41457) TaxID=1003232 RepID=J8ZX47_EDHAE|nr:hypothetical protein EDEG_01472 [Edhazardia aedis USNM 41457]|eukprot:EJW04258.1 hypothetical protein EDEG_01472 [Edhazardia aedis USNM 41457]
MGLNMKTIVYILCFVTTERTKITNGTVVCGSDVSYVGFLGNKRGKECKPQDIPLESIKEMFSTLHKMVSETFDIIMLNFDQYEVKDGAQNPDELDIREIFRYHDYFHKKCLDICNRVYKKIAKEIVFRVTYDKEVKNDSNFVELTLPLLLVHESAYYLDDMRYLEHKNNKKVNSYEYRLSFSDIMIDLCCKTVLDMLYIHSYGDITELAVGFNDSFAKDVRCSCYNWMNNITGGEAKSVINEVLKCTKKDVCKLTYGCCSFDRVICLDKNAYIDFVKTKKLFECYFNYLIHIIQERMARLPWKSPKEYVKLSQTSEKNLPEQYISYFELGLVKFFRKTLRKFDRFCIEEVEKDKKQEKPSNKLNNSIHGDEKKEDLPLNNKTEKMINAQMHFGGSSYGFDNSSGKHFLSQNHVDCVSEMQKNFEKKVTSEKTRGNDKSFETGKNIISKANTDIISREKNTPLFNNQEKCEESNVSRDQIEEKSQEILRESENKKNLQKTRKIVDDELILKTYRDKALKEPFGNNSFKIKNDSTPSWQYYSLDIRGKTKNKSTSKNKKIEKEHTQTSDFNISTPNCAADVSNQILCGTNKFQLKHATSEFVKITPRVSTVTDNNIDGFSEKKFGYGLKNPENRDIESERNANDPKYLSNHGKTKFDTIKSLTDNHIDADEIQKYNTISETAKHKIEAMEFHQAQSKTVFNENSMSDKFKIQETTCSKSEKKYKNQSSGENQDFPIYSRFRGDLIINHETLRDQPFLDYQKLYKNNKKTSDNENKIIDDKLNFQMFKEDQSIVNQNISDQSNFKNEIRSHTQPNKSHFQSNISLEANTEITKKLQTLLENRSSLEKHSGNTDFIKKETNDIAQKLSSAATNNYSRPTNQPKNITTKEFEFHKADVTQKSDQLAENLSEEQFTDDAMSKLMTSQMQVHNMERVFLSHSNRENELTERKRLTKKSFLFKTADKVFSETKTHNSQRTLDDQIGKKSLLQVSPQEFINNEDFTNIKIELIDPFNKIESSNDKKEFLINANQKTSPILKNESDEKTVLPHQSSSENFFSLRRNSKKTFFMNKSKTMKNNMNMHTYNTIKLKTPYANMKNMPTFIEYIEGDYIHLNRKTSIFQIKNQDVASEYEEVDDRTKNPSEKTLKYSALKLKKSKMQSKSHSQIDSLFSASRIKSKSISTLTSRGSKKSRALSKLDMRSEYGNINGTGWSPKNLEEYMRATNSPYFLFNPPRKCPFFKYEDLQKINTDVCRLLKFLKLKPVINKKKKSFKGLKCDRTRLLRLLFEKYIKNIPVSCVFISKESEGTDIRCQNLNPLKIDLQFNCLIEQIQRFSLINKTAIIFINLDIEYIIFSAIFETIDINAFLDTKKLKYYNSIIGNDAFDFIFYKLDKLLDEKLFAHKKKSKLQNTSEIDKTYLVSRSLFMKSSQKLNNTGLFKQSYASLQSALRKENRNSNTFTIQNFKLDGRSLFGSSIYQMNRSRNSSLYNIGNKNLSSSFYQNQATKPIHKKKKNSNSKNR